MRSFGVRFADDSKKSKKNRWKRKCLAAVIFGEENEDYEWTAFAKWMHALRAPL